ncbi:MAG: hypothetical protein CVV27_02510 [Candidatus Melainabacteria bacterium HGW-Melainabacteria-1]|nr:MAG: hypothetical protein CVV27_02510 [Candidatus Melainabacteria bacterium HGW-Melainabacteria-1]
MPAKAADLLRQLLALTLELQNSLAAGADDEALEQQLDARQALLDQLAALPPAQRHLSPETEALLAGVQTQAGQLLDALEARRHELNSSQSNLSTAHTALRAYHPQDETESHFIEEKS